MEGRYVPYKAIYLSQMVGVPYKAMLYLKRGTRVMEGKLCHEEGDLCRERRNVRGFLWVLISTCMEP